MRPTRDIKRLQHLYGVVAKDQNESILKLITGKKILELGCGYGAFVNDALASKKESFGLDTDENALRSGGKIFPCLNLRLIQGDMNFLPFRDKSIDTVVLRESLHHVQWNHVLPEVSRICKKEVIVFEPNPNWLLRTCRKIISHQDCEIPSDSLIELFRDHGIAIEGIYFRDVLAFPLSGGFVGRELFPPIKWFYPFLIWLDNIFQGLLRKMKMERLLSWRYILKGVLREMGVKP